MRRTLLAVLTLVVGTLPALAPPAAPAAAAAAAAAALPEGFADELVTNLPAPTAVAFTRDGRMLVATQAGRLHVVQDGVLRPTPALDLSARTCSNSERGLLGVATEPGTDAVFLFWTAKTGSACPTGSPNPAGAPVNRVSRFTLGAGGTVDPASEVVLVDGIYSNAGNHNAGDLHVGKDGHLYVSTGDGGCDYAGDSGCAGANDAARDRNVLVGKVLRVTRDGGVPSDNPYTGSGTASCRSGPAPAGTTCREIFATGLRNPFRMAFDPDAPTTTFRINDVGQNAWEEVDQGTKGADYGWNAREGYCQNTGSSSCGAPRPAGYTDPVHAYGRDTGCASITGGAYVPDGAWPAAYDDAYLFADYVCGKIFALAPDGQRTELASGLGGSSAVHLAFGPHAGGQALYYTSYAGGGQVRRISATGAADRAPTAAVTATPSSGAAPLSTVLDGSGSADPDGGALTYLWSFGDGSSDATTTTPTVRHTYPAGQWTATLRVRDPAGSTSAPATVVLSAGNTAPSVTITSPTPDQRFDVGEPLVLRGSATDAQDGTLPASALSWTVIRRHADHTHPFLGPVAGDAVPLTAPGPEDLAAAGNSYLEVRLTATDSRGVTTTVVRDLRPRTTQVTVATQPAGRTVSVNGEAVTGPTTLTSWVGFPLTLSAAAQSDGSGRPYGFDRWSDGTTGASRTLVTPASATTVTAELSLRGLVGAYHDAPDLAGEPVVRLDRSVAFDWGSGAPAPGIEPDTFSVRWSGQVVPRHTGTHTFTTTSDDGVRLWVDGRLVVDRWDDHAPTEHSGTVELRAGVPAAVTMEHYDASGGAVARLEWASAQQPREVVPTDRLRPAYAVNFQPAGSPVPPGYVADTGLAFGARGGLEHGWAVATSRETRDRDSALSPDQRYDTLTHLQRPQAPDASWELAVPDGAYRVRLVAGDPSYTDSTFALDAEGAPVLRGRPTAERPWVDASADVTITDGRLTVGNGAGAVNNKLSFLELRLR